MPALASAAGHDQPWASLITVAMAMISQTLYARALVGHIFYKSLRNPGSVLAIPRIVSCRSYSRPRHLEIVYGEPLPSRPNGSFGWFTVFGRVEGWVGGRR